jgi:hypothetical protein
MPVTRSCLRGESVISEHFTHTVWQELATLCSTCGENGPMGPMHGAMLMSYSTCTDERSCLQSSCWPTINLLQSMLWAEMPERTQSQSGF